jgi:hypothetical protein
MGLPKGDTFGIRGTEAALALMRARAVRFLSLALIAEGFGVGITVWQVLNDRDMSFWIAAAAGISALAIVCTFAFVRSF